MYRVDWTLRDEGTVDEGNEVVGDDDDDIVREDGELFPAQTWRNARCRGPLFPSERIFVFHLAGWSEARYPRVRALNANQGGI